MPDVPGRRPVARAAGRGAGIGLRLFPAAAVLAAAVVAASAAAPAGPCQDPGWHGAADPAACQRAGLDAAEPRHAAARLPVQAAYAQGVGPADAPRVAAVVGGRSPVLLDAPYDVAVNATGHVFVAVAQHGRIEVFAPDGEHLRSVGLNGSGPGLGRPEGIAVNATGHIYATDAGVSRLLVLDSGGAGVEVLAERGRGRGQLSLPGGVALDAAGRAYVADAGNSRVLVFNPDGTHLARVGSTGLRGGSLHLPAGVAVSPSDGRIFVSDPLLHKIEVFGHNRQPVSTIRFPAGHPGHAALPYGLAVDPSDGRLFAASLSGRHVVAYNQDGTHNSTIGGGLLGAPSGVAVRAATGHVYVSDLGRDRVVEFDRAGSHVRTFGGGMRAEYELGYPLGVAAGPGGRLAVADAQNDRVLVYAPNGTGSYAHALTIGGRGAGAGQLDSPAGVEFGPGGRIYVADRGNARLQAFGPAGGHAAAAAPNGTGAAGLLLSPIDVAADPRTGLVAAADNGTIVLIGAGADGGALRIGSRGDGPAQFKAPHGVALDRLGRVIVADTFNGRVQVLERNGSHLFDIRGSPLPGGGLLLPFGVASGPHGKIFVADSGRSRVQVFDHAGRFVTEFGRPGSGGGQLDSPRDISVYPDGRVAVADSGNRRVQVFEQADPVPPRPASAALRWEGGPRPGHLVAGDTLEVAVEFTERVRIDASASGAVPALLLNAAGAGAASPAAAAYLSGNGTYALEFSYTVRPGDEAAAADYASDTPFLLGGSLVTGMDDGNLANLTMPAQPGRPGSLSHSGSPAIDAVPPAVLGVSSPGAASAVYGLGETIPIRVDFSEAVQLGAGPGRAAPSLELAAGPGPGRAAPYASGNGTGSLYFAYEVREGDRLSRLDYAGTRALSGAIADAAGNAANLTLPEPGRPGSLSHSGSPAIDAVPPAVLGVSSPGAASAVYGLGETIPIRVDFSEAVRLKAGPGRAAPSLELAAGPGPGRAAPYASGNGTGSLYFAYEVREDDRLSRLDYAGTRALSGAIADAAGNAANLTLPEPGRPGSLSHSGSPAIDAVPPAVLGVSSPGAASAVYGLGETIHIRVEFSEAVQLGAGPGRAAPSLELAAGPGPGRAAPYASGNGTESLYFAYEVREGDRSPRLDYAGTRALSGAIADAAGNAANLTLPEPGGAGSLAGENVSVFANRAPAIEPVAAQRTAEGLRLRVEINASDPDGDAVTLSLVRPHPEGIVLRPGGALEWEPREGQAGSYAVAVSAADGHGLSAEAAVGIDVLTVADAAPAVEAVRAPAAAAPAGPAAGGAGSEGSPPGYSAGQAIPIYVEFSQPVLVSTGGGIPYVELHAGSAGARALYHSGGAGQGGAPGTGRPAAPAAAPAPAAGSHAPALAPGPSVLEFRYVVRDGDVTGRLSYAGAGALVLNGGSIESAEFAGVQALTFLPRPGSAGSLSSPPPGQPPVSIATARTVLDIGVLDEAGPAGPVAAAAHLAAARFNSRQAASGDDGQFLLRVQAYDAGATPASAAAALESAHSGPAGPSVYVGPSTDRGLHAAMPYAAARGIVLVSAGSTAPSLAVAGDRTFRLLPSDGLQADALARLASRAGAVSVYAVVENASYGPAAGSLDVPPPPGRFSHGFGAALDSAVPGLSGIVALGGPVGGGGGRPDGAAAAAAAAALDAAVRSGGAPAAVVYLGSPGGLAALAARAADYPDLRSAQWLASGLSAGSGLLAGGGGGSPAAAGFAAQVGLAAVRWSPPENALAREIDLRLANVTPGALHPHGAHAAYDGVTLLGMAAADAGGTDAAGIAGRLHSAASSYEGALGDIALDPAGDLWVPARYGVWEVARAGQGGGASPEWVRQPDANEARACSIGLGTGSLDFGSVTPGEYTAPAAQTVINLGQLPLADVNLRATPWYAGSGGECRAGSHPSLPVELSEIRSSPGGAFAPLSADRTTVARGLGAGGEAPLWYRINLTGHADLPRILMVQCVTYVAEC